MLEHECIKYPKDGSWIIHKWQEPEYNLNHWEMQFQYSKGFTISTSIEYCPFCGTHLETQMKHQRVLIAESNEWNRHQELNAQIKQAKIEAADKATKILNQEVK